MCRWLERDPAGYQDGPSLYSYLGRNPMAGTDPYGLYYRGWWDDMKEGFGALKEYWGSPPTPTQWWQETSSGDTLHETLQLIGLVPGLGEPADILDGVVYTLEGDTANASVSFAAALPVVGSAATASRWGKRAANAADAADDVSKAERARSISKGIPESQIGPSGKPKIHVKRHPTRKRAQDAAQDRSRRGGTPELHPNPAVGDPHYHPDGPNHREHHSFPAS